MRSTSTSSPIADDAARAAPARRARVVALYLPQYHPIPENDAWWGTGFTEWTNVAKARPLFPGHYQPHVPADLGFYDLRVPETRAAQAEMARAHGVEAFCYYHYWFAGRRILERPFDEVLASGEPDFPFCLCWANESWRGVWHGAPDRMLIEQRYPGVDDHRAHFEHLLPALTDPRYFKVDGKPFLAVYQPRQIPDLPRMVDLWREMAHRAGFPGLHLVGADLEATWVWDPLADGFDASFRSSLLRRDWLSWREPRAKVRQKLHQWWQDATGNPMPASFRPTAYRYEDLACSFTLDGTPGERQYPCLLPNWDNTPRSGRDGVVLHGSTPERFRVQVRAALRSMRGVPDDHRILIAKSWNEWAEGNHLEPDLAFGRGYLEALRDELALDARTRAAADPSAGAPRSNASSPDGGPGTVRAREGALEEPR